MKISNHAKMRIRERTDLNRSERKKLFRMALDKGQSLQDIKNEEVAKFVEHVQEKGNCKVKVYLNYIFIYSKNRKLLYTMYKLPAELCEIGGEEK